MKYFLQILLLTIILLAPSTINAHPGRTDSAGCHTCRTNCPSWGLQYDEYHCHNGGSTGGSAPAETVVEAPVYIAPTIKIIYPTRKPLPSATLIPTEEPTSTPIPPTEIPPTQVITNPPEAEVLGETNEADSSSFALGTFLTGTATATGAGGMWMHKNRKQT
jgi:hypothetical protein